MKYIFYIFVAIVIYGFAIAFDPLRYISLMIWNLDIPDYKYFFFSAANGIYDDLVPSNGFDIRGPLKAAQL